MTSKLDPQELERLSKSAEQEDDDVRYYGGPTSTHRPARDAYHAALVQLHRTGQLVPAMPSASCDLCAAECRGHPLGDSAAWEPEPGSREWARRNPAMPSGDVVEAVARALYEEDDPWCKAWPWPNLQPDQGSPDAYRRLATAAITTYEAVSGVAKMRDASKTFAQMMEGWGPEYFPARIVTDYESTASAYDIRWEDIEALRAALGEKP